MEQREKLIEVLSQYRGCFQNEDIDCGACDYKDIEACLNTRFADHLLANGVVVLPCRCEECEYWECGQDTKGEIYKKYLCDAFECGTTAYDFCSYGKRKGGDE